MGSAPREFQVFAKPSGANCNLRCSYCYYINNKKNPGLTLSGSMSDEVLENYIKQNIEASTGDVTDFSWHGGEPLMAGIGFYQKVRKYQKKYNRAGKQIINGIQTNGTLINKEWADFLSREKFFIGLSLDGPEYFHDSFRRNSAGAGSFEMVMNGFNILKKYRVPVEVLCVVSSLNAGSPLELYTFFRELGVRFITFLPLVEKEPSSPAGVTEASVGPEEFGNFLIAIFDEWKKRDIGNLKIQIIEEALRTAFNQDHTLCIFKERCGGVPVLEHDGSIYSCDHYVDRDHLIGNILEGTILQFLDSQQQRRFGDAKKDTLPARCLECPVLSMCNGECPRNRFVETPGDNNYLNYLCKGYKVFFNHCKPFADAVAAAWRLSARSSD